jgi:tetratricopeptide (TPR) repeat protein
MTMTAQPQIPQMLQSAVEHLNRGELPAAETLIQAVLGVSARDFNALQLLGLIREQQGNPAEAEPLYRRSLAANPRQPHTQYNLGTLLYRQDRFQEAIPALEEARRQKRDHAEAYLFLGHSYQALGNFAAAEQVYRAALGVYPNFPAAKASLGGVLCDQKRPQEAEQLLREAIATGAKNSLQLATLHHNLALALKMQRRFEEALPEFEAARSLAPELAQIYHNEANTMQALGRIEESIAGFRKAIELTPLDASVHGDLNRLLYRQGRDDEFLTSIDNAAGRHSDSGPLTILKADLLFKAQRYDEALESYERAAMLEPQHVTPHDGQGMIHARMGNFQNAIRAHERAVTLEPDNAHAWTNFAETLLRAGDAERSKEAAERALEIDPTLQNALGIWGLALRSLDDPREAELNDYEKLVQTYEMAAPEGYADMASFNRELRDYLEELHWDVREPVEQTLRKGTQTHGNLFGSGHRIIEKLRGQFDQAVRAYITAMPENTEHPLSRRRGDAFVYSGSWSSRLRDSGYLINHVRPMGWISSCYYLSVPEAVADGATKEGWTKFGEPEFDAGFADPVRRTIQPKEGMLVLFPSYMWHGTIPFHGDTPRTTIAFDVVPR